MGVGWKTTGKDGFTSTGDGAGGVGVATIGMIGGATTTGAGGATGAWVATGAGVGAGAGAGGVNVGGPEGTADTVGGLVA